MNHSVQNTTLQIGEERIPPGEEQAILEITRLQTGIMQAKDPHRRGQHAKAHGCVDATFTVLVDIPEELKVGIFGKHRSFRSVLERQIGR